MVSIRKSIPLLAFVVYFSKSLFHQFTMEDVIVLISTGIIAAIFEFYSNIKQLNDLNKKITDHEKQLTIRNKELDDLKTHVASIKLATGIKSMSFK